MSEFPSFLRLNNIPLYAYTHFVYTFISRQFSCLHLLAVVNNAAMNMGVQISPRDPASSLWDIYSEVGLLDIW